MIKITVSLPKAKEGELPAIVEGIQKIISDEKHKRQAESLKPNNTNG